MSFGGCETGLWSLVSALKCMHVGVCGTFKSMNFRESQFLLLHDGGFLFSILQTHKVNSHHVVSSSSNYRGRERDRRRRRKEIEGGRGRKEAVEFIVMSLIEKLYGATC